MQKKNFFKKRFNKTVLSITYRIESFFNFFKENFSNKKNFSRSLKTIDKKIFISVASICIAIIGYFIIPAFYDQNKIKVRLENQILDQYNLQVKLDQSFRYGIFPKPHFSSNNTKIEYKSNSIAESNNAKIFISIDNFFSPEKISINNIVFNKTDFKIERSDLKFFVDLLNNDKSREKIDFLNSKFFYIDDSNDVIFLINLKRLNYLFQEEPFKKIISKFEIFNVPMRVNVDHNISEKSFFTEINSHPLRIKIESSSNYTDEKLDGEIDLTMINKNRKINYVLKENYLNFNSINDELFGEINIKPFFLSIDLKYYLIDLKKIFKDNSILINILKSEILNNKNLNGEINIKADKLKGFNFIDKIQSKILLEEGDIIINDLKTIFKESVIITLNDTQLIVDDNNLKFSGFADLDFINVKKFFEHYQINIKDRKYIKKIKLGFLFHFDNKFVEIDNLKVDGISNKKLESFLKNFNSKKENIFNKIIIRNSIKDFFKIIS